MQLAKKKVLAAKVLKVGKGRIIFVSNEEIKEAITRQDILDLVSSGAIQIREVVGKKKIVRRKHRRGVGKIKKKVKKRKQEYVKVTRKLRKTVKSLLRLGKIDREEHREVRKQIRARKFRSNRHLNETVGGEK